jgi:hypothetical protein
LPENVEWINVRYFETPGGIMKTAICILFLLFYFLAPASVFSAEKIGYVQTMKGSVSISRGSLSLPAQIGGAVNQGDVVRTSGKSSVGIVFDDNTTLSLGPNSELLIKNYAFDPKAGKFAFLARMIKGTFVYLSGLIGKLSPDAVQLEIPEATIAVRGTKLLIEIQE